MAKRGAAPKGEYSNKTKVLSTRIRADTRALLDRAAEKNGRSLSQEIERRLRRTFEEDARIVEIFGSPEVFAMMRTAGSAMTMAASNASKLRGLKAEFDWLNDPWAYSQACRAVGRVLGVLAPPGVAETPARVKGGGLARELEEAFLDMVGASNANKMLDAIRTANANGTPFQKLGARIRDGLGPELTDRIVKDFERDFGDAAPSAVEEKSE